MFDTRYAWSLRIVASGSSHLVNSRHAHRLWIDCASASAGHRHPIIFNGLMCNYMVGLIRGAYRSYNVTIQQILGSWYKVLDRYVVLAHGISSRTLQPCICARLSNAAAFIITQRKDKSLIYNNDRQISRFADSIRAKFCAENQSVSVPWAKRQQLPWDDA